MSGVKIEPAVPDVAAKSMPDRRNWFAAGSVITAALASACCIVPLVLLMLGVSGAWIGNLTALEPYKPIFAGAALVFVALGFHQVYFKAKPICVERAYCARPESALIAKSVLWLSTALVVLALTISWWAPLFY